MNLHIHNVYMHARLAITVLYSSFVLYKPYYTSLFSLCHFHILFKYSLKPCEENLLSESMLQLTMIICANCVFKVGRPAFGVNGLVSQ